MAVTAWVLSGLAWLAFSVIPARAVVPVFLQDPNYSHGLLFPVVAGLLAWRIRGRLAATNSGPRWPGFIILAGGGALAALGHWYHTAFEIGWRGHVFLQGVGWLVATAGWICVLLGWRRFGILAPRLGFMVFVVPLPDTWLLTLMLALQRGVAVCSAGLLRAIGLVVYREGNLLYFPDVTLGVAGACSGIRSLMAFFATAAVCAVFLDLGTRRSMLLLALAPVVAVGFNILRVIATSLLAIYWGPIWLAGRLHEAMGLGVVLLGGAFLFAVAQRLRPPRRTMAVGRTSSSPPIPSPAGLQLAALFAALLLGLVALGMRQVSMHYQQMARRMTLKSDNRLPLAEFPQQIGPFHVTGEFQLEPFERELLKPSDHLIRTYDDKAENQILLAVQYWAPRPYEPGASTRRPVPHSPHLCWRYEGWDLVSSGEPSAYDWLPGARVHFSLFEKTAQKRIVLHWRSKDAGTPPQASPGQLARSLENLVESWHEIPDGWGAPVYQVRVETDVHGQPDEARACALDFIRLMAHLLPDFGIGAMPQAGAPLPPAQAMLQSPSR